MNFLGLNDFQFKDQRVLLRLDLNAPIKDGAVTNDERLVRSLPTINHILNNEGRLIVISHLGRPKEDGELQPDFSLSPVVKRLEQLLNRSINLITDVNNIPSIETGEMIVLENVRFLEGEKSNDPELSKKLANIADIFVMDAFATSHRAHSSTTGVIEFSEKACAGFLLEEEVSVLSKLTLKGKGDSLAVLGGAKISTKLDLINSLCDKMDTVILGGGMPSRLFEQVREKRGLAYSVSSMAHFYSDCGVFYIDAGVAPENTEETFKVIIQELNSLKNNLNSHVFKDPPSRFGG